jgi:cytidyltransferase-like protein
MGTTIKVKQIKEMLKNKSEIVFCSGVFDLFHYGHFKFLQKASKMGKTLIVQIDGNRLVKKRKGKDRPYLDQIYRALMISSFDFVDYVFISNKPSESKSTLKKIKPTTFVRVILPAEAKEDRVKRTKSLLKKYKKMKIAWVKQTPEISTTKMLSDAKAINKGVSL